MRFMFFHVYWNRVKTWCKHQSCRGKSGLFRRLSEVPRLSSLILFGPPLTIITYCNILYRAFLELTCSSRTFSLCWASAIGILQRSQLNQGMVVFPLPEKREKWTRYNWNERVSPEEGIHFLRLKTLRRYILAIGYMSLYRGWPRPWKVPMR